MKHVQAHLIVALAMFILLSYRPEILPTVGSNAQGGDFLSGMEE
nr:hypothetical protein 31 [bacterium]